MQTVDLSAHPDLVVIYLGIRVNRLYGLRTLIGHRPQIGESATYQPDGLLLHESLLWLLFPCTSARQYWRDHASLLTWARSEPHRQWWLNFLRDCGGTGFWHETDLISDGMEAVHRVVGPSRGIFRRAAGDGPLRSRPAPGPPCRRVVGEPAFQVG
ncbi:hypothetical protein GCM10023322_71310 [Rugosimonospora acidiphila]|uniref:DUF4188 domain-containing protein n=1 Tax=Rugosimonospora acidiphila TaxID=556531 RepID=A0ABP9SNC7_9ACTN